MWPFKSKDDKAYIHINTLCPGGVSENCQGSSGSGQSSGGSAKQGGGSK